MASERQIAANQRNAQKSTGPRSQSGRRRASKNAYRHGLAVPLSAVEFAGQLMELARQFAGASDQAEILVQAERAAHAQLELLRVRTLQTAITEEALTPFSAVPVGHHIRMEMETVRKALAQLELSQKQGLDLPRAQTTAKMALLETEWPDERQKMRQILPELNAIHRYARRAAGQRDRAISKIIKLTVTTNRAGAALICRRKPMGILPQPISCRRAHLAME